MKKTKSLAVLYFFLFSLAASLLILVSGKVFIASVSSLFDNIGRLYSFIIVAPLTTAVVYFLYQHFFTKKFTKKGLIITTIILSVLAYSGIQGMLLNKDYYFTNTFTLTQTVISLVFYSLLIISSVSLLIMVLKGVFTLDGGEPDYKDIFKPVDKVFNKIVFVLFIIFSLYFLGDSIMGLLNFSRYTSFFYFFVALLILLSFVNLFFVYYNQKSKVYAIVLPVINLAFIFAFVLLMFLDFGSFIEATESLLLLEYASSMPIGIVIFIIMDLGSSAYFLYHLLHKEKPSPKTELKADNE